MATDNHNNPTEMQVELVSPEKVLFSGPATMVQAPGTEGVFGVLPGHEPFISTLKAGVITIDSLVSERKRVAVLSGIAEVVPTHCILLIETALDCSDMTDVQAAALVETAKAEVENAVTETEKRNSAQKLALAEAIVAAA